MSIPLQRTFRHAHDRRLIAYDLETTRIKEGMPDPLYLTAYGENFKLSIPIMGKDKFQNLCDILEQWILIPEFHRARFVAWNGNAYDGYFVGRALVLSDKWILRPYLTRTKALRGIRVQAKEAVKIRGRMVKLSFEFLDGMAMTGLYGKKLATFLKTFAPAYPKLILDFGKETFNPENKDHVKYADRDSEALYHGMKRANTIMTDLTGNGLQPTIGNAAIKFFASKIPDDILCWQPPGGALDALHGSAKRGGYCWVQQQYQGPVWKYDINQAYAAAMRDARLPAHRCVDTHAWRSDCPGIYRVYFGRKKQSLIPFYYKTVDKKLGCFTCGAFVEAWLTSSEIEHLLKDHWQVDIMDGYFWSDTFNMSSMVNELEILRGSDPDGPNGPLGTLVKMIGNNAYGKTLEQLEGVEIVMAKDCPEEYMPYDITDTLMDHIFFKMVDQFGKAYHQPQIGIFITAHVRMLVRDAALQKAEAFLYADTDAVVFSEPVTHLDIDPKRYGAWKQETDGERYIIIGKKIYASLDTNFKRAKGIHIKELSRDDFIAWKNGNIPVQRQLHRQNFLKAMAGKPMFQTMDRHGTDVLLSQQAHLIDGRFVPISQ